MDHARGLGRARALGHGPGAGLLRADGEEGDEAEQRVARPDHALEPRLREPERGEELGPLGALELGDLGLDRGRDDDPARALFLGHLRHAGRMRVAGGRGRLLDVADIEDGLGGQQLEAAPGLRVLRRHPHRARRAPRLERLAGEAQQALLLHRLAVAAAHPAGEALEPALDRLEVGEHQLGLHRLGVGHRVDAALDMGDVVVLEAAQHVGDGVDLADVGEELVAEPLAARGAAHEPGDVDEGQPRRDHPGRAGDLGQPLEARVGHRHLADVGLDGAEGIVLGRGRGGRGERVEQRRLADVGQTDDAGVKSHRYLPSATTPSPRQPRAGG